MRLRGKVDDGIDAVTEQRCDEVRIADIALHEGVSRITFDRSEFSRFPAYVSLSR
jgi:hypothetical protein